jgi:hypothetical protein
MGVAGVGGPCWYQRRTCPKCGVELVSSRLPRLIMAPVWPAGGRSTTPVSSLHAIGAFDEPGILIVFLVICRLLRKLCRRQSSCQRLPSAAASITCLIASTVTWACSLFHPNRLLPTERLRPGEHDIALPDRPGRSDKIKSLQEGGRPSDVTSGVPRCQRSHRTWP